MLTATITGIPLGTSNELVELKQRVQDCIKLLPFSGSVRAISDESTCSIRLRDGFKAVETVTFLDSADQRLLADAAVLALTRWRNAGVDGEVSNTEVNIRRIAATKIFDNADVLGPTDAATVLGAMALIEKDPNVLVAIITSLRELLTTKSIAGSVQLTTRAALTALADPTKQTNPGVLTAAKAALATTATRAIPSPAEKKSSQRTLLIVLAVVGGVGAFLGGAALLGHYSGSRSAASMGLRRRHTARYARTKHADREGR